MVSQAILRYPDLSIILCIANIIGSALVQMPILVLLDRRVLDEVVTLEDFVVDLAVDLVQPYVTSVVAQTIMLVIVKLTL